MGKPFLTHFILITFTIILGFSMLLKNSKQLTVNPIQSISLDDSCILRLSEAIQIQTVSFDNSEDINYEAFDNFHRFLNKSFPLVHSKLIKYNINKSLVFEWKGMDSSLKPAIYMAHMDVVPANGEWKEAPFSGTIKDGYLWGRGTLDDKGSLMALFEATEVQLQTGYVPNRTIYFAFGEDEETSGKQGAISIVQWMKERNIEAEFVLDEGMVIGNGLVPGIDKPVAMIGISEKGFLTVELTVEADGGHASMPAEESAISILSQAILLLQSNGFDYDVTEPVTQFWNYIGPEMPLLKRFIFSNLWLFKGLLVREFKKSNSGKALLHTTIATTIFKSGVKENVVPHYAETILNIRTLPEKNNNEVLSELKRKLNDDRIKIKVVKNIDASPVSSIESLGFNIINKSIREVFPNSIVAPSLMIAGTDSKHYTPISKNIYRFLPLLLTQEDLKTFHGANEKISVEGYKNMIRFYIRVIQNS